MPFAVSYLLSTRFWNARRFSAPVLQLNDTAIGIAELVQQTLHGLVVRVRVDADVSALLHAPVHAERSRAMLALSRRDTVNNAVRRIVQPGAAANDAVGRLAVGRKRKVAAILRCPRRHSCGAVQDPCPAFPASGICLPTDRDCRFRA
mgnify:CR=1 FL=1